MNFDTREFRTALGCFPTGIVVVTAGSPGNEHGITVNSFTSVSLDPPLVLWCIAKSSRRYDLFTKAEEFTVSVLSEDEREAAEVVATAGEGGLCGVATVPCLVGPAAIAGALSVFCCTQEALHDGGDHRIIVGRVRALHYRDGAPLAFFRGRYEKLAN